LSWLKHSLVSCVIQLVEQESKSMEMVGNGGIMTYVNAVMALVALYLAYVIEGLR